MSIFVISVSSIVTKSLSVKMTSVVSTFVTVALKSISLTVHFPELSSNK